MLTQQSVGWSRNDSGLLHLATRLIIRLGCFYAGSQHLSRGSTPTPLGRGFASHRARARIKSLQPTESVSVLAPKTTIFFLQPFPRIPRPRSRSVDARIETHAGGEASEGLVSVAGVCLPMMLFGGARNGSKTLRHVTEKISVLFSGRGASVPTSGACSGMASSCEAKLVNAVTGTRRVHTAGRSFFKPAVGTGYRGLLSDRPVPRAGDVPGIVSGSRSLWTGNTARATTLDTGRRLMSQSGVTPWGLVSRCEKGHVANSSGASFTQTRGMKIKIKPYSSWKRRFQITKSGLFKRKQKGKRHKAFSKSPAQRMRLRGDRLVHETLMKPMKKLGFKLR